jgi:cytochrome c553
MTGRSKSHSFAFVRSTYLRSRSAKIFGAALTGTAAIFAGAILFAWSGAYDVAASSGHWASIQWFLDFGMRKSVERRTATVIPPALDDPDLIRLGAGHFHRGCAFCHGAPGIPVNPIARHMLPSPPDLAKSMRPWNERELFWIVQHGLKYTGMPGWAASEREDEIWAVVAFLKRLPTLDADSYRDLALGNVRVSQRSGVELATSESHPEAFSACARCHGAEGQAPLSNRVPVLQGQPAEYLVASLQAYAEGTRRSGIMQPLAADLQQEDMRRLADYYAGLRSSKTAPKASDVQPIESGRKLALEGAPTTGIPACITCHVGSGTIVPHLAGQHAAYLAGQLRLWKIGDRSATGGASMMAPIAQRLNDDQIAAVSAYFASLSPGAQEARLQSATQ